MGEHREPAQLRERQTERKDVGVLPGEEGPTARALDSINHPGETEGLGRGIQNQKKLGTSGAL